MVPDARQSTSHQGIAKDLLGNDIENYIDWPSKSPDCNPIENVWVLLKNAVRKRQSQDLYSLETFIWEEWEKLNDDIISNVASSFHKRLNKIINSNGNKIDY